MHMVGEAGSKESFVPTNAKRGSKEKDAPSGRCKDFICLARGKMPTLVGRMAQSGVEWCHELRGPFCSAWTLGASLLKKRCI